MNDPGPPADRSVSVSTWQGAGSIPAKAAERTGSWARRALRVLAAFSFVGGLVTLGLWRCPMALLLHVPCPGCGLTRATLALLRGDPRGAFHFHPMVFVVVPLLALFFGANAVMYIRDGRWGWAESKTNRAVTALGLVLILATFVVWVARFFGAFGGPVPV